MRQSAKNNITHDDVPALIICALAFALPFTTHLLSYGVILGIIATLFQTNLKEKISKALSNRAFQLISGFYLLHLFGLIYSKNLSAGVFNVQIKLTLLAVPLIIFTASDSVWKYRKEISIAFVAGNVIASIICIILSFENSYKSGEFLPSLYEGYNSWSFWTLLLHGYTHFNYSFLSHFIHVNYFSVYLLLAVYLLYQYQLENGYFLKRKRKLFTYCVLTFLLLILILLQSRAALLSLILLIFIEITLFVRSARYSKIKLIVFSSLFLVLIGFLFQSGRFISISDTLKDFNYEKLREKEIRVALWESSWKVVRKNPLLGVGTGDVEKEFRESYSTELKKRTENHFYDVHNEYLLTTMRLGIVGLVVLIILLVYPLFSCQTSDLGRRWMLFFHIIFSVNFLFESMLNRFNGVIIFALLYSILSIGNTETSNNNTN